MKLLNLTLVFYCLFVFSKGISQTSTNQQEKSSWNKTLINEFKQAIESVNIRTIQDGLKILDMHYRQNGTVGDKDWRIAGEVLNSIQIYIRKADQHLWNDPSPERLNRIEEIAEAIEPYKTTLINLGEPAELEQGNAGALRLLFYAKPNEFLQKELHRIANLSNPRGAASDAYYVLVNLGLDSPEIHSEIANRISEYKNSNETPDQSEVFYGSKDWRIKEAIPAYLKQLQLPQATNYIYDGRVRLIAEAVEDMGSDAAVLLPELKRHLALMKEKGMHFTDINVLERTIYKIENNISSPMLAMNGSGLLKRYEEKTSFIQTTNTAVISPQTTNFAPSKTNALAPKTETKKAKNSHWPKWLPVIIGLGLIISLLVIGSKRKKKEADLIDKNNQSQ